QRELPVFALSDYGEFLDAILLRDMTEGEQERMRAAGISYTQYLRFFAAARRAETLGVRLLMD
ncbi:MAG: hypothetical protein ACKV2V_24500, partial [Blastocatellia bacterium]